MLVTRLLQGEHGHHHHSHGGDLTPPPQGGNNQKTKSTVSQESIEIPVPADDGNVVSPCNCCSDDPGRDLNNLKHMAAEIDRIHDSDESHDHGVHEHSAPVNEGENFENSSSPDNEEERDEQQRDAKLMRMSINTAAAIALHNFPEGLATFVSTLADPKVGAVLAVAIAIHNIPEGLCVAMPIYYATGKRWNAFAWGCLSGISEPLAACLGWAALASVFNDVIYAVLFGMVGGMMVIISARELLPTGHRYDPDDSVTTYSFIAGMVIIAISLVLFKLS